MPESVPEGRRHRPFTATLYVCVLGNSPETMVAQLVAEEFDCDPHEVSVVYQGTERSPGQRARRLTTTVMLAGAVEGASGKIKEKAVRAAAHLLEADVGDLEWRDGGYEVRGVPEQRKTLAEIAACCTLQALLRRRRRVGARGEQGLRTYTTMPPGVRTSASSTFMGHACQSGGRGGHRDRWRDLPVLRRIHDCGTWSTARCPVTSRAVPRRGSGQRCTRSSRTTTRAALTASYLDYLVPTSVEVPELTMGHHESPSPWTPHGIKGGGEGGRMMAPAAINVAVNDALAPLGGAQRRAPAAPEPIRTAMRAARGAG